MYLMMNFILLMIFIILIMFMNKKSMFMIENKSNFECGFESSQTNRSTFSLRFFSLTVVFLLFDMEFSIIFPMTLIFSLEKIYMILILSILMVGFMLEWNQGSLNWK